MLIKLGEKEYDLRAALPVTLGDIRRLKKNHGLKLADLASMDLDVVAMVLLILCQKVDAAITEEMIDTIPITRLAEVAAFLESAVVPDHPTSG